MEIHLPPTEPDLTRLHPQLRKRWDEVNDGPANDWKRIHRLAVDLDAFEYPGLAKCLYHKRSRTLLADLFNYRFQSLATQNSAEWYKKRLWAIKKLTPANEAACFRHRDTITQYQACLDACTCLELDVPEYWPILQTEQCESNVMPIALTFMCGGKEAMASPEDVDHAEYTAFVTATARKLMDTSWRLCDALHFNARSQITDFVEFEEDDLERAEVLLDVPTAQEAAHLLHRAGAHMQWLHETPSRASLK